MYSIICGINDLYLSKLCWNIFIHVQDFSDRNFYHGIDIYRQHIDLFAFCVLEHFTGLPANVDKCVSTLCISYTLIEILIADLENVHFDMILKINTNFYVQ